MPKKNMRKKMQKNLNWGYNEEANILYI